MVKKEKQAIHELISSSSASASMTGSSVGTPMQFVIPDNMNKQQKADFFFEVMERTQVAVATINQSGRQRRSDQEERKKPKSVGQPSE
jgi:hypothetical protein